MAKRGVKSYEEKLESDGIALMPPRVIAQRLGMSERSAQTHLASAFKKLAGEEYNMKNKIGKKLEEIVLQRVYAVASSEQSLIRCGSVECIPEFRELYSNGADSEFDPAPESEEGEDAPI